MSAPEPVLAPGLEPAPALAAIRTARKFMEALAEASLGMERDQLHGQLWALRRLEHELQLRLEAAWGPGGLGSRDAPGGRHQPNRADWARRGIIAPGGGVTGPAVVAWNRSLAHGAGAFR